MNPLLFYLMIVFYVGVFVGIFVSNFGKDIDKFNTLRFLVGCFIATFFVIGFVIFVANP